MPLAEPPPRDSRFGSPLKLSRAHWVRPEVVVEVTYLTWTEATYCGRSRIGASERTSRQGKWCGLFRIQPDLNRAPDALAVGLRRKIAFRKKL
jgi:hypothetical protein